MKMPNGLPRYPQIKRTRLRLLHPNVSIAEARIRLFVVAEVDCLSQVINVVKFFEHGMLGRGRQLEVVYLRRVRKNSGVR